MVQKGADPCIDGYTSQKYSLRVGLYSSLEVTNLNGKGSIVHEVENTDPYRIEYIQTINNLDIYCINEECYNGSV